MHELSDEEKKELKNIFDNFDKDENGCIDWDEFNCMADELVGDMALGEKSMAFHLGGADHNGWINFEELITWWGKK